MLAANYGRPIFYRLIAWMPSLEATGYRRAAP